MLRRIVTLSIALLALAPPAWADGGSYQLHTQMASGAATSSRHAGGCAIATASHGALVVTCRGGEKATLVYTFSSGSRPVHGQPMGSIWASRYGRVDVDDTARASGRTIRLTVTVSGGQATIGSVCVSYYA